MELRVTSQYLRELADKQDLAAGQIGSAGKAARGIGTKLWVTHGVVCGATNEAVTHAEAARRAAAHAMRGVSTDLAAKLRDAARHYDGTDVEAATNLDDQVR